MKQLITLLWLYVLTANISNAQSSYFTTFAAGSVAYHTLAIKNDGTLWTWGYNNNGQLGDGTTTNKSVPTQVGTATIWSSIAAGGSHSLAITADGKLWAWGLNSNGQLGDGTTTNKKVPTLIGMATNWVSITAGANYSFGITADGKLWAWGNNTYGQLGDGTTTNKNTPTQIGSATNWASISADGSYILGITADGKAWAWGQNNHGQLGNGTTNDVTTGPKQIGTATNWASISAGYLYSLGITADGKLWAWGYNNFGQLGDGTTTDKNKPTQIGAATNWASISAGYYNSFGITADGKLWAWGNNGDGQLGDGTGMQRTSPTQIGSATNWVSISAKYSYALGITADGKAWAWGDNGYGQLGDGTTSNVTTAPEQITINNSTATLLGSATMQQGQYNFYNNGCTAIAAVSSTWASITPISGSVTAKVWVEATQSASYVGRHYQITPATNASTATGRVTLYFLQAEFDAFNVLNSTDLPSSSSDAAGIANLLIEKRPGTSSDGSGLPSTYTGTPVTINPTDADIIWNSDAARWEVSFYVAGFSGFFVKTQSAVLPAKLIGFTGSKISDANVLTWNTTNEVNTKQFIIEWSMDAANWNILGATPAKGDMTDSYTYDHTNVPSGKIFYRLKMIDQDGQFTYSNIIWLNGNSNSGIVIYPNPVKDALNMNTGNSLLNTTALLTNMEGKLLQLITITANQQQINVNLLPSGMYILTFADGTREKFVKE